jgi:hypothetical protein
MAYELLQNKSFIGIRDIPILKLVNIECLFALWSILLPSNLGHLYTFSYMKLFSVEWSRKYNHKK